MKMDNIGPRGHFDQGRKFDENNEQQIWEFFKRSSLLRNYAARKLITLGLVHLCSTVANVIKLFTAVSYDFS